MKLATAVAILMLCGCTDNRRDAAIVLEAIHRFRTAPNDNLPAMVDALKATPCKAVDVCQARDECVSVGEPTAKALLLKSEVEQALNHLDAGQLSPDSDEAKSLTQKLDDASTFLQQGHAALPRCDSAVETLKRRYNL